MSYCLGSVHPHTHKHIICSDEELLAEKVPLLQLPARRKDVQALSAFLCSSLRFYQIRAGLKVSPRVPHRLLVTTQDNAGKHKHNTNPHTETQVPDKLPLRVLNLNSKPKKELILLLNSPVVS